MAFSSSRLRKTLIAAVGVLASAGMLVGCTEQPSVTGGGGADNGAGLAVAAGLTRYDGAQRVPAPVSEGPAVVGTGIVSSSHPGRVVVMNVWQSTCGPCRAESAALNQAAKQTSRQATFLGLDVHDQQASAQAFLRTSGSTYAHVFDPDSEQLLKFAGTLPLQAIPSTLVIDRQGRIAARIIGPVSATTLTELVDDVAAST